MDVTIPGILAGGEGRAIQQAGRDISQAGQAIAGFIDKIQENYDYNDASDLKNEAELKKQAYHMDFWNKEDGSDAQAMTRYVQGIQDIDREYNEKAYEKNNRVGNFVERYNKVRTAELSQEAQRIFYKQFLEKSIAVDRQETDLLAKSAINTGEINLALNDNTARLLSRQSIYGKNVNSIILSNNAYLVESFIKGRMANPVTALEFVNRVKSDPSYKQELYKHLPADKVDDMEKLLASAGSDSIRQAAYNALYVKHNGNFVAMNEDLSKPETQKEYGLGLEDSFYIKRQISDAQGDKDKADLEHWDKTATEVFLNLKNITPGQIDRLVQQGDLSYQLGEHFKQEKKQQWEGATDPQAYYNLYSQIKGSYGEPDALKQVRQKIFSSSDLSLADKKSLLTMTETTEDKFESEVTKRGLDYIKSTVMPSQTMISAAKPTESANFLEAMKTYDDAIKTAKKNGEKINAETVNRIAKEISQIYSMTIYDQIDAVKEQMQKDKEKRSGIKYPNFKIKNKEDKEKIERASKAGKIVMKTQSNPAYPNKKRIYYTDGTFDEITVID